MTESKRQDLTGVLQKFLPGAHDPAEPYWAIVGVTASGDATGDLWGAKPASVTLFDSKELGLKALETAGQPSPEPPVRMKRWEVRGLSNRALQWLRSEPTLRPHLATAVEGGHVVTRPLD